MPRLSKRKAAGQPNVQRRVKSRRIENTPKRGLCRLPEELLLEILDLFLDSLYDADDAKSLYSLCLTSRQWYRLAKDYLYNIVDNRLCNPRKLLGAIVDEPGLAGKIRNLAFLDEHGPQTTRAEHDNQYALTHIERRELCKKVEEFGLTSPRHYSRIFNSKKPKDVLAGLMLLSPGIQCIDICDQNACCYPRGYLIDPAWIRILAEVGFNESSALTHHFRYLHTIRISMGPIRFKSIAPILGIQSLRTLMLEDVYQGGDVIPWLWDLGISPRSSPLEYLYLENSLVDTRAVSQLLHSIRNLRLFVFEFDCAIHTGFSRLNEDTPPKCDYQILTAAILEHKDSLEQLSVENSGDPEMFGFPEFNNRNMGSLRDMHRVRFMDIGLDCLDDPDLEETGATTLDIPASPVDIAEKLPCGLTQLDVNLEEDYCVEYEIYWPQVLIELAKKCKTCLPSLKGIKVARKRFGRLTTPLNRREIEEMRRIFDESGVSICFEERNDPMPFSTFGLIVRHVQVY